MAIKRILVPTDFSEPAQRAFAIARTLAEAENARITVLHIQNLPPPLLEYPLPAAIPHSPPIDLEALRAQARAVHPTNDNSRVEYEARVGDPAAEILDAAKNSGADIIVMSTHGRTGLRRLLIGSVTEEVLRRAPCAVLAFRSNVTDEIAPKAPRETAVAG